MPTQRFGFVFRLHRSIGITELKMISGGTVVKAFHYRNFVMVAIGV
jgi:hypothetical protein